MSSVLKQICIDKIDHIAHQKSKVSIQALEAQAQAAELPRGFIQALRAKSGPSLIAEVKKASPSKGVIREDFDPVEIATLYEQSGAACISVLTDEPYFQGKDAYLEAVKAATTLPILRKDFMIDPYQIIESRVLGADCILLIMAALSDAQAKELADSAKALNMDVLIEVHDASELERALLLNPEMIGVNNRNLKSLEVDVQTSFALLKNIPQNILKVAESGLSDAATIGKLYDSGYQAFLIGESLMVEKDISAKIHLLFPEKIR